jgi:hypothetical protein
MMIELRATVIDLSDQIAWYARRALSNDPNAGIRINKAHQLLSEKRVKFCSKKIIPSRIRMAPAIQEFLRWAVLRCVHVFLPLTYVSIRVIY